MGREFELKYRATPQKLEAIAAQYHNLHPIAMETTYYDTPDQRLSPMHWTLRRRMENGTSVCTLKIPHPDGGRGEWEVECGSIEGAIVLLIQAGAPDALAGMVSEGLVPTCGARFTRLAQTVAIGESLVEVALDEGCLMGGSREEALAELEVELKEGRDEDAIAYARLLAARYGLTEEPKSKFRRALDLRSGK